MPVDLMAAGLPSAYPDKPRFVPWLVVWALCCAIGAPLVLLLWPAGEPARGVRFWFCVAGGPNVLFLLLFGIGRAGYEAVYVQALYRNRHRQIWLNNRVAYARRPLQVLGLGHCLPLGGKTLSEVVAAETPLLKAQAPRHGSGLVVHSRFAKDDPLFDQLAEGGTLPRTVAGSATSGEEVPAVVKAIARAIEPLVVDLHALSQYGLTYAPAVRVPVSADAAQLRVQQVRHALLIAGVPPLECMAVPATDGVMMADTWLDAREPRPLLVIAVDWHDQGNAPPVGSTEGCVAMLLGSGAFKLPEPVRVLATLHRPVSYDFAALSDILGNAILWSEANAPTVHTAWLTGFDATHDRALLAALEKASLTGVSKQHAQRRVDRLVGRAGVADAWISIAAAVESGIAGPHLILHNRQAAQAAVLHVNSPPSHDKSDE